MPARRLHPQERQSPEVATPIVQSTTYVYDSTCGLRCGQFLTFPTLKSLIYSRFANPTTVMAVEDRDLPN